MARNTADTIRGFLTEVRSGRSPEVAGEYLAPVVLAHQVRSGARETVERSPANYTEHVAEMIEAFGAFEFRIDELLIDGDRGYARWTQHGTHVGEIAGVAPTGRALETVGSAVYRVADGRIVEYWIQLDPAGLRAQLS
ncbi:ester cyclase [Leucobacter luti]|uniref:SnoaL-like polyketide cyclase n=1 Tax=Leucobacter luti TaxID=340320 RepID=A0A4Q7TXH2_9MICO|nr:ester cyclase [Leucobacter luti]MBL3698560.1 ester cyclase [Leucobacter luti]RZT65934.1 SnoaL-like polyketide cyclase [Leucobacter luti]